MIKKSIKASEIVRDIHQGVEDAELVAKYGLNEPKLLAVFERLVAAGKVTRAEIETRDLAIDLENNHDGKPLRNLSREWFIATSGICLTIFGLPFLIMLLKIISGLFQTAAFRFEYVEQDFARDFQYTVVAGILTFLPPTLVWLWKPTVSLNEKIEGWFRDKGSQKK